MFKRILKEYWYCFLVFIIILTTTVIKLPYRIQKTGGLINLNSRIKNYETSGSFNMAYVNESDATVLTYLYSLVNDDWDLVEEKKDNPNNDSEKEINYRGKIFLQNSNQVAELVAYHLANKDIKVNNIHYNVVYVDKNSKTDIKIGDEITAINGIKMSEIDSISELIQKSNNNVKITVLNDNKEYIRTAKLIKDEEGKKIIGILIIPTYDFKSNIEYETDSNEYGPSGGLMMTLTIYDHITNLDLTKGRIIAGTGTIDMDGTIGEISGVKYKLKGAVKENAEIFFVPEENYKEALKYKDKYNYKIKIVKVTNINEAIDYLKK